MQDELISVMVKRTDNAKLRVHRTKINYVTRFKPLNSVVCLGRTIRERRINKCIQASSTDQGVGTA